MRIAPLADVKARLSAYLDECGVEGPVVITRNGKPVAVLLVPYDDDDLERLLWGVHRAFKRCSTAPGKASMKGKAYPRRRSGRRFASERGNGRQRLRDAAEPADEVKTRISQPGLRPEPKYGETTDSTDDTDTRKRTLIHANLR